MPSEHTTFVGDIPELYDRHLGPLLFLPYARDLAGRVAASAGSSVLELACGTGILTRARARAVEPSVAITATDLNDAMIAVARDRVRAPNVTWQVADATALPFENASFDTVVCQFGLMFVPDKQAAARQVHRVLRAGGSFWFSVWGSLEDNPLARVAHETIGALFENDPPAFYHVPYGYQDPDIIMRDLRAGGLRDAEIETVDATAHAPSAAHAAIGFVMGTPVVIAIRERGAASVDATVAAVAAAIAREFGGGPLSVPMRALVIRAR
jgi:SAM-dependent methyltransferase